MHFTSSFINSIYIQSYYLLNIKCHQVALTVRISMTLFHHPSLTSIFPGKSSRLYPVPSQNWYIYIYWQNFFINTNFVEHNRHFLSTYFLVDPFILPYWFYHIRQESINVFSIIVYIPSTFCLTLGHHQGRIYYKSDVTFVFKLLLCKKKNVCTVGVSSVYF